MTDPGREPGALIGRGRAADVYALDARRVLRRYRTPYPCAAEADPMRYLRQSGYPVPEVFDVAMAFLIMASSDVDDVPPWMRPAVGGVRHLFVSRFLAAVRDDHRPYLAPVAEVRLADPNVRAAEAARIRRLARTVPPGP